METTNLVVNQVVECDDTPDKRRQVYHQHHVICFHCTKEMELKAAVVEIPENEKIRSVMVNQRQDA